MKKRIAVDYSKDGEKYRAKIGIIEESGDKFSIPEYSNLQEIADKDYFSLVSRVGNILKSVDFLTR